MAEGRKNNAASAKRVGKKSGKPSLLDFPLFFLPLQSKE